MRSHWEERDELDLDAPATITERDLRSLRRRAGFGVLAVLLSVISIAGLAWTLYAGPEGLEQVQGVKERLLDKSGTEPEGTASVTPPPQAGPPAADSLTPQPLAADSATATPPGATPSSGPESRRVSTQGSQGSGTGN